MYPLDVQRDLVAGAQFSKSELLLLLFVDDSGVPVLSTKVRLGEAGRPNVLSKKAKALSAGLL